MWMTRFAGVGALLICSVISALAGSPTKPRSTAGCPTGAPGPPGVYFANDANWGCRKTSPQRLCVGVEIPVLVWSTPWSIFGARLMFSTADATLVGVSVHDTKNFSGWFNPFSSAQLAWDLGNGWGFSYLLGAYVNAGTPVAYSSSSLNQRFALSYTGNDLDLTANVVWGVQFDQVTSRPQTSPCPVSLAVPSNGC